MATKTKEGATQRRAGAGQPRVIPKDVLVAARRHYDHGETLASIAASMGISGSYLGRLLRSAREAGWVRVEVAADPEVELAAALHRRFPHLEHVDVVQVGPEESPEVTARAIGMAQARWLNTLLEEDEESGRRAIYNIAIGGAAPHAVLVEQTLPRRNRISVGPTALTPERGKVARFNASTLSALLALRLGALAAGDRLPPTAERSGYRYALSVDPPQAGIERLREWYASLEGRTDYLDVVGFWKRLDVAFVSAVGIEFPYTDVRARLAAFGSSVEEMKARGAIALMANQFVDTQGEVVPIAPGVATYEPAISVADLRRIVTGDGTRTKGYVVLDLWGGAAEQALPLAGSGIANVLMCDARSASSLLTP